MLRSLRDSPFRQAGRAHIYDSKMPLLEVYISQFLSLVGQLIKRGIRSDYVSLTKNTEFLKGRLLISQQIRRNTFHPERFCINYQEYIVNRPANRLIKTALQLIHRVTRNGHNQRLAREYNFVFDEVPPSEDVNLDFQRMKTDRSMTHYKEVLSWCRLLLYGYGPTTTAGDFSTLTLLYPMERIFEDYVAECVRKRLNEYFPTADRLLTQSRKHYLVESHAGKPIFSLRPDLFVQLGDQSICAMDTKWKLINENDRSGKYGITQTDMYQLYAYGHKYLKQSPSKNLKLIYPKTDSFTNPLPVFEYEGNFTLEIVPFDIASGSLVIN